MKLKGILYIEENMRILKKSEIFNEMSSRYCKNKQKIFRAKNIFDFTQWQARIEISTLL